MKRLLLIIALCAISLVGCNKYDAEIADLQRQIDELETARSRVNDNVISLGKLVEALEKSAQVTSFTQVVEGGQVVGYTVTFTEEGKPAESVTVYNSTANVSVGEFDGKYYWMVNGKWLTDDAGNKVEACTGPVVPQFRLVGGVIEVSLDGGATYTAVGEVGTPVIDNVIDSNDSVTFQLASGAQITLSKQPALSVTLNSHSLTMAAGGSRTVKYTITGGNEDTSVIVWSRDGWRAEVEATNSSTGFINITSPNVASESQVLVIVSDNGSITGGRTVFDSISVVSTK